MKGAYILIARLARPTTLTVGGLGEIGLQAGEYAYVGSAMGGLRQRIARHLRASKRRHWHIDYLLAVADGVEPFVWQDAAMSECELHQRLPPGEVAVAGFGASDCRCRSHLAYFPRRPEIDLIPWNRFRQLPEAGSAHKS